VTINANIGATVPSTNDDVGSPYADYPGAQSCPNCRKTVKPHVTNGPSHRADGNAALPLTGAGYSCPSCGHSFSWKKSTGIAAGPVQSGATNANTAADM
jgi:hypothetical protein